MNAKELGKRLEQVAEEWPLGARVWHIGCGSRGVVVGYAVKTTVALQVAFCADREYDTCQTYEVSASRVSDGSDGDAWKDGEEGAGV